MNAGPLGPQDPDETVGSEGVEGTGPKGHDRRTGLVLAGIAFAALIVGGLIFAVVRMAG